MKIVFLDRATIGPTVKIVPPKEECEWIVYDKTDENQIVERLKDVDIVITNKVPIQVETIKKSPKLKMISVAATGYNVVDVEACLKNNITVSNVRGYAIHTVPEHTFAIILALRRNLTGYRQDVIDGYWQKSKQFCFFNHNIHDLNGSRLGIIGKGAIGEAVAKIGQAFGMEVIFSARKGAKNIPTSYTSFEETIETSDIITLHLPLTTNTENLISKREFQSMKHSPIFINTARGGLVDEEALVDALDKELISAVGLDVLTSEPPKENNPLLKIAHKKNVIITPHVAWASKEAMQILWEKTIANIDNFLIGNPSNIVH